jgi:hypothetical protein
MLRWLLRGLEALLALLILFEEWGWESLHRLAARVARLPPLAWLERHISALPPYGALVVVLLPTLALLPLKVAALWLIGIGRAGLGLGLILAAKVFGTALLARLFHLTQPALMRLAWFARLYGRWTAWKAGVLVRVRASWAWRIGRVVKRRVVRWRSAPK